MDIAAPDSASPGDELTYTITVANGGVADAEDVVLEVPLPDGLGLIASRGCDEDTPHFPPPGDPAGSPRCGLGTLPAGTAAQVIVTAAVHAAPGAMLDVRVDVLSPSVSGVPTTLVRTRIEPPRAAP